MAVAIRLKRIGRLHRPCYRLEAIDRRNARGGRSIEKLGFYDPLIDDAQARLQLKLDRVRHWIEQGARPSHTVTTFLRKLDVSWGKPTSKNRKSRLRKRRAERRAAAGGGKRSAKK
ncbi:MAG: 30S ribosomal protein S16 [Planctomycetes bacterium]|nr:30S ribosomal protein S16 [Planctomycetota bacterium]